MPLEFIQQVFETMARCPQHTFQILTKRSERLRRLAPEIDWPGNVDMPEAMLHLMHPLPAAHAPTTFRRVYAAALPLAPQRLSGRRLSVTPDSILGARRHD